MQRGQVGAGAAQTAMNGLQAAVQLLRVRHVGAFLAGRATAATGAWMERIAFGWLVWEATQSVAFVGALAFARLIPAAVFGLWGGVLADRRGSIAMLRICYGAAAFMSLAIAVALAAGLVNVYGLLGLALMSGALQALANGPMKAAVSEVSPRHLLATAVPVSSVTFNAAAFIGPALAGILLATLGAGAVFLASAATALGFALVLSGLPRAAPKSGPRQGEMRAITSAAGAALAHPVIGPHLLLHLAFSVLMRPIIDLLPAVAGGLFAGGPATLSLLTAAMGVGAFAGSLWLTWASAYKGLTARVLAAALGACIAALVLCISATRWQAALAIGALGAALVIRAAGGNTVVQLAVEDGSRGRVMALWGTVLRLGSALGGFGLGVAAEIAGLRGIIAVAAIVAALAILPAAIALRRKPE